MINNNNINEQLFTINEEIRKLCLLIGDGWVISETGARKVEINENDGTIKYIYFIFRSEENGFFLPDYSVDKEYYKVVSKVQKEAYIKYKDKLDKIDELFKRRKSLSKRLVLSNNN